jgi:thiol:disulfide interchange protein
LRGRIWGDSALSVLVLGAVSGLAGFCTGPILGAVLTVAATSGQALRGGILLAVYAAGMTAPLFVLALLWDRFDLGRRQWLRGRRVTLGRLRLRLHSTSLISGTLFIMLGILLLVSGGTTLSGLPALPASMADRLQVLTLRVQHLVPDLVVIAAIGVLAVLVIWRRLAGAAKSADAASDTARERP